MLLGRLESRQGGTSPDGRPIDRVWIVPLRRRNTAITIAENLGWPSAKALSAQLEVGIEPWSPWWGRPSNGGQGGSSHCTDKSDQNAPRRPAYSLVSTTFSPG